SANELAILLRAGSLPAKLTIVEERTVGASLGADSINAGIKASIVAHAGIVLTMGMAVDANVLIYERMREESHAGRSTISALDTGFRRAFATIIDSHLTALIAAIALFELGSGPIRGFAVTLAIGIISTLFTAYLVTRLIVSGWVRWARPK